MLEEQIEKTNNPALKTIGEYLLKRAETDPSVSNSIKKENKSLDECFKFIKSEAKKKIEGNCAMLSDDEVFGLAVHYYDEDDIKIKKLSKGTRVVANTSATAPTSTPVEPKKEKQTNTCKKKKGVLDGQITLF